MYESDPYAPPQLWPRFVESKYLQRTLAFYSEDVLTLEGGVVYPTRSSTLVDALFVHNVLCFVSSLSPLLVVIRQAGGHVYCNKDGIATSARIKARDNSTRWIIVSSQ